MKKVLVLGADDLARLVGHAVTASGHEIAGFVADDEAYHPGMRIGRYWVYALSSVADWPHLRQFAVVSGTVNSERAGMVERLGACEPCTVVHEWARVDGAAEVMPGAFINAGAVLDRGAVVGEHAVVGQGAMLGHGVEVGSCVTIGPGAVLCDRVEVGRQAVVGAGATVREGVRIGEGATVGMGAVVLDDVPDGETWWGTPAAKRK